MIRASTQEKTAAPGPAAAVLCTVLSHPTHERSAP